MRTHREFSKREPSAPDGKIFETSGSLAGSLDRTDVASNAAVRGQFDVGMRPPPIEATEAFSICFLDEIGRLDGWTTITPSLHLQTTFVSM